MATERDENRWTDQGNSRIESSRQGERDRRPAGRDDTTASDRRAHEYEEPERWDGMS